MKIYRTLISVLVCLSILAFCVPVALTVLAQDYTEYTIAQLQDKYKTQGRTEVSNGALQLDWSSSGMIFTADCSGDVSIKVTPTKLLENNTGGIYFTVIVDGETQYSDNRIPDDNNAESWTGNSTDYPFHITKNGESTFTVAKGLSAGKHTIEIYNQTEPLHGSFAIKSISLKGTVTTPPTDNDLYLEFIGDSITTGLGNISTKGQGAPLYQDATRGWAYLIAKKLNADWSIVAQSGIVAGEELIWNTEKDRSMTQLYTKLRYDSTNNTLYDFKRQPDVIIIGLGTNDIWSYQGLNKTITDVKNGFVDLLNLVRQKNPNSKIVWIHNMMLDTAKSSVKSAISEVGGAEKGFYDLELFQDFSGGQGHPGLAAQTEYADMVSNFIKTIVPESENKNTVPQTVTFKSIEDHIKTVGRTSTENGVIWADQSASGIKFYVKTSGKITLTLAIDPTFCNDINNKNIYTKSNGGFYFSVFVNGEMQHADMRTPSNTGAADWTSNSTGYPFHLTRTSGTQDFVIADLPKLSGDDYYTVEIYNQTEHQRGTLGFESITFENDYIFGSKPKDEAYYIEYIGDSITCGDGNIATGRNCGAALYEDATRGWPVLTSKTLNADWSLVSKSGGNAAGMNSFYTRLRNYTSSNKEYTFSRIVDAVVIGLGTNDMAQVSNGTQRQTNYKNLISTVRSKNPDVPIVWVYGMMRSDTDYDITAAVNTMGGSAAGIYTFQLPQNNAGGNNHPDFAAQTTYAQKLSAFLKTILPEREKVTDNPVFDDKSGDSSSSSKPSGSSSTNESSNSSSTANGTSSENTFSSSNTANTPTDTDTNDTVTESSTDNIDKNKADGTNNGDNTDKNNNTVVNSKKDSFLSPIYIILIILLAVSVAVMGVLLFVLFKL